MTPPVKKPEFPYLPPATETKDLVRQNETQKEISEPRPTSSKKVGYIIDIKMTMPVQSRKTPRLWKGPSDQKCIPIHNTHGKSNHPTGVRKNLKPILVPSQEGLLSNLDVKVESPGKITIKGLLRGKAERSSSEDKLTVEVQVIVKEKVNDEDKESAEIDDDDLDP